MTKDQLRKEYREKRKAFSENQIKDFSQKILGQLKSMPIWDAEYFHVFVSIKGKQEINTSPIINDLFESDKKVIVPKTNGKELLACQINRNTKWEIGNFNVPEPIDYKLIESSLISVVFVPMLICDLDGNRIGYGGGYYDRFLSKLNKDCLKIGLNFFGPIQKIEDVEPTDIPLDYCVTPDEIVSFVS